MKESTASERALVLAPHGRDAALAVEMLREAGIRAEACASLNLMIEELDRGAGFIIATEEALATADLGPVAAWLASQENWSDLPFVLLTHRGGGLERNPAAQRFLEVLGNVNFLERPFHPTTLVSVARSALRSRRRQYEARVRLEALQISEARYRTLFNAIDAGFCIVEVSFDAATGIARDYRFMEVNPAFARQTGLVDAEGRWMRELAPDHEQHWFDIYGQVARTGDPVRFEHEAKALGRFYDVHAFRVGESRARRVAILFNDITSRRRAEAELRELNKSLEKRVTERTAELAESERRFRGIFDSALQFMALLTPEGTVLEVNQTALAWSDITPNDIVGKPFWLASPMRDNPALQTAVEAGIRTAAAGETVREEHEMRGAGEVRATVDFSLKPILGDGGETIWLVAEGRDITELKLSQDALRQAQKMEAVGQLTGGIAHDFNNLLAAVMSAFDLIRRRPEEAKRVRRFAEAGLEAAERGARLTSQLLAFSRAQRIELKPTVIAELVEALHDLLSRTLGPMIRLNFELDEARVRVLSDQTQLEMAVLNLAINARDAMPNGGDLTIATRLCKIQNDAELADGEYVELAVTDTGSGMSPEVVARAFDPFFTTKGVGKGTGLGLSQVYGIARQAGGTVRIQSRPDAGTTVRIYLPRTQEAAHSMTVEEGVGPVAQAPAGTVLVVDDDHHVRRLLTASLDFLGYQVVEVADGPSALAVLQTQTPDLMMVDFAMPGMNGAELATAARTLRPELPIVFATGYADTVAIEEALGKNAPVLRKPFRVEHLQAVIAEALASTAG